MIEDLRSLIASQDVGSRDEGRLTLVVSRAVYATIKPSDIQELEQFYGRPIDVIIASKVVVGG